MARMISASGGTMESAIEAPWPNWPAPMAMSKA